MFELIVILVVIVLIVFGTWAAFNGLIKRRNRTQEAWSQIDVELKRRHDLVPNLVSTVQGYAAHEQGTFEAVTRACANAVSAGATGDPVQIASAENALSGALRSVFAVAENYPQLRAVESFLQLQEALTSTEDKIEYARRYYNTSVRDYNIGLQTFPRRLDCRLCSTSSRQSSSPRKTTTVQCLSSACPVSGPEVAGRRRRGRPHPRQRTPLRSADGTRQITESDTCTPRSRATSDAASSSLVSSWPFGSSLELPWVFSSEPFSVLPSTESLRLSRTRAPAGLRWWSVW